MSKSDEHMPWSHPVRLLCVLTFENGAYNLGTYAYLDGENTNLRKYLCSNDIPPMAVKVIKSVLNELRKHLATRYRLYKEGDEASGMSSV